MVYQDAIMRKASTSGGDTSKENYRFPGDFILERLELIDKEGVPTDISALSLEVNILQDLFLPFMQIEIAVNDSAGFIMPCQMDYLVVKLYTFLSKLPIQNLL